MMVPELSATLRGVAAAMSSFSDGWWIIGSAALALHGVDAGPVHDIDLLIDAELAHAVLAHMGIEPIALSPDNLFRSKTFAKWDVMPLRVEVMAGLHVAVSGQWQPVEPRTRQQIMMADEALFVPDRQELLALFRLFGRPKDAPRIQAMLSAEAAARSAASA
ncbi:hypothetical protein [Sphingomonas yabuuchiae]|uniref:hypothetical protein n=1 Tax=Sphingomonas yabuuchiae TaxID=172044 RepID=UPI003D986FE1